MYLKATCMLVFASALAACSPSGSNYQIRGNEVAVGADADLKITERDQNYEMDLKVEHLLPPERAASGARTYAVWIQPQGQQTPFHAGNLEYDKDARRGALRTVTPHASFDMFVTAEETSSPTAPQGPKILSEKVNEE